MKRKEFLSIVFAALALVAVITVTAQPQGGGRPQGTPEEMAKMMVERMSEELDLTKDQQTQIYDINVKFAEERKAGGDSRPSREEMEASREKMSAQIKSVLTEDQAKKYDEMEAKMRERGQGQGPRQQ
ncbi:MAG: DUF4890 domain-containing protein [Rikenellaceae bacterium]